MRKQFEEALKKIAAIQVPKSEHDKQYIYILFASDIELRDSLLFAMDFKSIGLSLIIEQNSKYEATIKIFDIESDDFYVNNKVVIQHEIIGDYANRIRPNTKLAFGVFLDNDSIDYCNDYPIDLKSVSVVDAVYKNPLT